jgi:acyl carrier protein
MVDTFSAEIKAFIVANFLFGDEGKGIGEDQSFLESGIIDSTGMLELVSFVEQKYGITVGDREMVPENLDSLRNVSRMVARKLDRVGVTAS